MKPIEINFEPSVKQGIAWDALGDKHTNFVGYGGSAYSGKSFLMCYWLLTQSLAYPGTYYGLGRRTLINLKKSTLETMFKVFQLCGVVGDGEHYTYNKTANTIEFYNGSKIFLIDTAYKPSDPLYERFGGLELTSCAIDESGETDEFAIKILFTRCGRRENHKYNITPKMLECFNPSKNHIYKRYYKPWKEEKLQANYTFIKALPQDNPASGVESYIQGLLNTLDKNSIERLVYGNFEYDDDPAVLMEYDSIVDVFTNDHILDRDNGTEVLGTIRKDGKTFRDKCITWDVAGKGQDRAVILVWIGLYVVDYAIIPIDDGTEQVSTVNIFKNRFGVSNSQIVFDADGIGGLAGMHFRGATEFHSGAKPLHGENYVNLKTQCYYKLAKVVNDREMYWKTTDVDVQTETIEELEQVKQKDIDKDGKISLVPKDQVKKVLGRSPDHSDALMLRMYPIVKRGESNARTIMMKF